MLCLAVGGCCAERDAPSPPPVPATAAAPATAGPPAVTAPALPPATARPDLAFLVAKQGAPLPRAEVVAGQMLVLGGFVRGIPVDPRGVARFWMKFTATAGDRTLSHFDGPLAAPYDLPEEQAIRLDLGVPVPVDTPPGPGLFRFEVRETGKQPLQVEYPFTVLAPGPSVPSQ